MTGTFCLYQVRLFFIGTLIFLGACVQRPQKKHVNVVSPHVYHRLVAVVPSYNNRAWYRFNLASIARQQHPSFRVIYIDDASSDGTAHHVLRYIKQHHLRNFSVITNKKRVGSLANLWHAIQLCDPDEIIVTLDGDDWFAHEHVLEKIDDAFCAHNAWFVYGQFKNWPTGTVGWSAAPPGNQLWRTWGFHFGQPRAFFVWLAQRVKQHDLIDTATGTFYAVAGDVALVFPLVEMASRHVHFIDEILTIRNVQTPLNDFKCHAHKQLATAYAIRRQKPYKPLSDEAAGSYN